MRKLYPIENTLLVDKYQKKVFLYYLKKNPKLLKYVFFHLCNAILYSLHIISEVKYQSRYWCFYTSVEEEEDETIKQMIALKKKKIEEDDGIYLIYAPKKFVDTLQIKQEIITLDDFHENESIYEILKKRGVEEFSTVACTNRSLLKKAKKHYGIRKGKVVEVSWRIQVEQLLKTIGKLAILAFVITLASLALTPLDAIQFSAYLIQPLILILNFIPVFVLLLVFYGILNNVSGSFTLCSLVVVILTEINRFKMSFRDDPFVFLDIKYAKEAAQMTNNYSLFIDAMTAFIVLVLLFVLLWLLRKHHEKVLNYGVRVCFVMIPSMLFYFTFSTLYLNSSIYNLMWNDMFGNQWKEGNQYIARGFAYSFLHSYGSAKISAPDGYDKAYAQSVLDEYETIDMKAGQKVNIIGIMLEAYNDLTVLNPDMQISEEVYHNFHAIQDASYSGYLYTDIFAGGTIATERAFLSGFSSLGEFRFPTDTYVSYLKSQGYYTEAMHPCYGWFYNRKNVNEVGFGFDSFKYYENEYGALTESGEIEDTFFGFLYDTDFFEQIALGYEENKERNMPYFNFSVTYQNHGPYSTDKIIDDQYLKWDDSYNVEDYNVVNNYLADIRATDLALGQLYDYINEQKEPIVLVFFGDHNPYLGEENSGFDLLGINLDLGTVEGGKNYYQTPYVITANQAAKDALQSDFHGKGDTISPLFLMNEVFEVANLSIGSPYAQYLKELSSTIDVINPTYIKKEDDFILRNEYEDDGTLETFYDVQFYQQYGKGH